MSQHWSQETLQAKLGHDEEKLESHLKGNQTKPSTSARVTPPNLSHGITVELAQRGEACGLELHSKLQAKIKQSL